MSGFAPGIRVAVLKFCPKTDQALGRNVGGPHRHHEFTGTSRTVTNTTKREVNKVDARREAFRLLPELALVRRVRRKNLGIIALRERKRYYHSVSSMISSMSWLTTL